MKRIVIAMSLLLPLIGCEPVTPTGTPPVRVEPTQASYIPASAVKPDNEPTPTAVDAAMAWAERYSQAVLERDAALERAREAERGQEDAEKKTRELQRDLEQVNRELADANKTLLVLQGELDKWKRDVLGFREEIRAAMAAELTALQQIMKVLGGELAEPVPYEFEGDDPSEEDAQ